MTGRVRDWRGCYNRRALEWRTDVFTAAGRYLPHFGIPR